jgi:tetratricopeptide (TPR) repeat protein
MGKWLITVLAVLALACLAAFAQIWLPSLLGLMTGDAILIQSTTNAIQLGMLALTGVVGYICLRWILDDGPQAAATSPARRLQADPNLRAASSSVAEDAEERAGLAGPDSSLAEEGDAAEEAAPAGAFVTLYTPGGVRIITEGGLLAGEPAEGESETVSDAGFDRMVCPGTSLANLDLEKVQAFLERSRVRTEERLAAELPLAEKLSRIGLVCHGVPTYGAILSFGRLPQAWVPSSVTQFVHWKGVDRQSKRYQRRQFGGDLTSQYEACLAFLKSSLGRGPGQRLPFVAIEEALANALVHRDYANRTEYVEVELFADRLEIRSPGRPPLESQVGAESQASGPSQPRNPLIFRVFQLYGHVTGRNTGLRSMKQAMSQAQLPGPEFGVLAEAESFRVTLRCPTEAVAQPAASDGDSAASEAVPLLAAWADAVPDDEEVPSMPLPAPAGHMTFTPASAEEYSAGAPVITRPFNLPADLPDFMGREAQVTRLRRQLLGIPGERRTGSRDEDRQTANAGSLPAAIVGITGMGGMGKTSLALHVAHSLAAEGAFPDAQLYINLKGTDLEPVEPAGALQALLTALLGPDPGRPEDLEALTRLWRGALHGKQALLLLDNAAHAAQVRPLLPGSPTCAVLITSRQRFALPGADLLDLGRLRPDEARRLLLALAPHLTEEEAQVIAERCAGLPLALRIAGNYLALNDDFTAAEYAAQLADERARLRHLRDPDDPDLDVAATLSLSVAQLDAGTGWAWSLLALFPAPFDHRAAAALWGDGPAPTAGTGPGHDTGKEASTGAWQPLTEASALERLRTLRNRSLVSFDTEERRYSLHDLLRLAARRELDAVRSTGAHARLARHFLAMARAAEQSQHFLELDPDWPHLRAALEYAAEEDIGLLSELALALDEYWSARGLARERATWSRRAAKACAAAGRHVEEGVHLGHLGQAYADLGNPRRAIEYYGKALATSRSAGDHRGEGRHLLHLGQAYADLGDARRAIHEYEQALAIATEIGDQRAEGRILGGLGNAHADLGEAQAAIGYQQRALQIAQAIGDRRSEATHLDNLGRAQAGLGDMQQAIACHRAALAIQREVGDCRGEGNALDNLGRAYASQGQIPRAIDYLEQALEIARRIGDQRAEGAELGNLGNAYADLGDGPRAIRYYEQALALARETGDRRHEGTWLGNLGRALVEQGDIAPAMEAFQQAMEIAREIGDRHNEATWLGNLGRAHSYLGEIEAAVNAYEGALAIHREVGDRRSEATWLGNLGLLAQAQGDTAQARGLWVDALGVFQAVKDPNAGQVLRWLADLEGEPAQLDLVPVGLTARASSQDG